MLSPLVRAFKLLRVSNSERERCTDLVAIEEPLDIRVGYWFKDVQRTERFALTMRTPGFDRELATGLLFSEGLIGGMQDVIDVRSFGTEPSNEIIVDLAKGVEFDGWRLSRNSIVSSSCGVCGKRTLEMPDSAHPNSIPDEIQISPVIIERLPLALSQWQEGFAKTGGLHAAALIGPDGDPEQAFEDIGRHNALDKVIGWSVLNRAIPLQNRILFVSSRSSFELVQKAVTAGCRILASVGGPSSLAVELARKHRLTLIGFVRDHRFNVYSGEWRLKL